MAKRQNPEVDSKEQDEQRAQEVDEYWTEERVREAKPTPTPVRKDSPEEEGTAEPDGPPVISPEQLSDLERSEGMDLGGSQDPQIFPGSGSESGTECNATKVTDASAGIYKRSGRMVYTLDGQNLYCSAGAIDNYVILTAAHCLYKNGKWGDNWKFFPGYPDMSISFTWKRATVFTKWQNDVDYAYDYGMILTWKDMVPQIGCWGWAYNYSPKDRRWFALGYPQVPSPPYPADGRQMYRTSGKYAGGSSVISMNNNNMHSGASGSAWVTKIDGQGNYANSVYSYTHGTTASDCKKYGPYFDSKFKKIYEDVQKP